ncbi:hypothetical protein FNF28_00514 [Cafeteria roenbergensis]|uniref:Uncharacterized protein n=1 Tax=Cafeteria roenbergensis TaxID=33653 RepID=A0A5A8E341_CAFRO|nr:hypothetical protein FNF28_00514 [Cafeteria roenbergensis]
MAFIVKHYVVKTLTSVCGEYVEGITSDKLDLSLVSGEVRLRDLSVKPAVLALTRLPLRLVHGTVDEILVRVPAYTLAGLRAKPIEVVLRGVSVLLEKSPLTPTEILDRFAEAKRAALRAAELLLVRFRESASAAVPRDAGTSGGERETPLLTAILDNLRISIENVHVRFEDDSVNPERGFACGLTLRRFSTRSEPDAASSRRGLVRRVADVESLAVYWDHMGPGDRLATQSKAAAARAMTAGIADAPATLRSADGKSGTPGTTLRKPTADAHSFIVAPCSPRVVLLTNSHNVPGQPGIEAAASLPSLRVDLNEEQFRDVTFLERWLSLKRFRPDVRPTDHETVRQWWWYAVRALGSAAGKDLVVSPSQKRWLVGRVAGLAPKAAVSRMRAQIAAPRTGGASASAGAAAAPGAKSGSTAALASLKPSGLPLEGTIREFEAREASSLNSQAQRRRMLEELGRRRAYILLYKRKIWHEDGQVEGIAEAQLAAEQLTALEALVAWLEEGLTYSQALVFRLVAAAEVGVEQKRRVARVAQKQAEAGQSWFGSIFQSGVTKEDWQLTGELRRECWLGLRQAESQLLRMRALEDQHQAFDLDIGSASLALVGKAEASARVQVEIRAVGTSVGVSVGRLSVRDGTALGTCYPVVVGPREKQGVDSALPLLDAPPLKGVDESPRGAHSAAAEEARSAAGSPPADGPVMVCLFQTWTGADPPPTPRVAESIGPATVRSPAAAGAAAAASSAAAGATHTSAQSTSSSVSQAAPDDRDHLRVVLRSRPLRIVASQPLLRRVAAFFAAPAAARMSDQLSGRLAQLRKEAGQDLYALLENRPVLDIDLSVGAPLIVLPANVRDASSADTVLADLGHLRFATRGTVHADPGESQAPGKAATAAAATTTATGAAATAAAAASALQSASLEFDRWHLELSDARVGMLVRGTNGATEVIPIVHRVGATLELDTCVLPASVAPTQARVRGSLPRLSMRATPELVAVGALLLREVMAAGAVVAAASASASTEAQAYMVAAGESTPVEEPADDRTDSGPAHAAAKAASGEPGEEAAATEVAASFSIGVIDVTLASVEGEHGSVGDLSLVMDGFSSSGTASSAALAGSLSLHALRVEELCTDGSVVPIASSIASASGSGEAAADSDALIRVAYMQSLTDAGVRGPDGTGSPAKTWIRAAFSGLRVQWLPELILAAQTHALRLVAELAAAVADDAGPGAGAGAALPASAAPRLADAAKPSPAKQPADAAAASSPAGASSGTGADALFIEASMGSVEVALCMDRAAAEAASRAGAAADSRGGKEAAASSEAGAQAVLASVSVTRTSLSVRQDAAGGFFLAGSLGDFVVWDEAAAAEAKYKRLVGRVLAPPALADGPAKSEGAAEDGAPLVEFEVASKAGDLVTAVDLRVRPLGVVFYKPSFDVLLAYVLDGVLGTVLASAASAATEALASVDELSRTRLGISVDGPTVCLPASLTSEEGVVARLASARLATAFSDAAFDPSLLHAGDAARRDGSLGGSGIIRKLGEALVESQLVAVSGLQLFAAASASKRWSARCSEGLEREPLGKPLGSAGFDVDLGIHRALSSGPVSGLLVDASVLSPMRLRLAPEELRAVLRVLTQNLGNSDGPDASLEDAEAPGAAAAGTSGSGPAAARPGAAGPGDADAVAAAAAASSGIRVSFSSSAALEVDLVDADHGLRGEDGALLPFASLRLHSLSGAVLMPDCPPWTFNLGVGVGQATDPSVAGIEVALRATSPLDLRVSEANLAPLARGAGPWLAALTDGTKSADAAASPVDADGGAGPAAGTPGRMPGVDVALALPFSRITVARDGADAGPLAHLDLCGAEVRYRDNARRSAGGGAAGGDALYATVLDANLASLKVWDATAAGAGLAKWSLFASAGARDDDEPADVPSVERAAAAWLADDGRSGDVARAPAMASQVCTGPLDAGSAETCVDASFPRLWVGFNAGLVEELQKWAFVVGREVGQAAAPSADAAAQAPAMTTGTADAAAADGVPGAMPLRLPGMPEDGFLPPAQEPTAPPSSGADAWLVGMDIRASLGELALDMRSARLRRSLGVAVAQGLSVAVTDSRPATAPEGAAADGGCLDISGSLSALSLRAPDHVSGVHPMLVRPATSPDAAGGFAPDTTPDVPLVYFAVQTRRPGHPQEQEAQTVVRAVIQRLFVTYLHQEVMSIVQFLLDGVLGSLLLDAAAVVNGLVKEASVSATSISVDVDAPIVFLPESAAVTRGLLVDTGRVTVRNSLHRAPQDHAVVPSTPAALLASSTARKLRRLVRAGDSEALSAVAVDRMVVRITGVRAAVTSDGAAAGATIEVTPGGIGTAAAPSPAGQVTDLHPVLALRDAVEVVLCRGADGSPLQRVNNGTRVVDPMVDEAAAAALSKAAGASAASRAAAYCWVSMDVSVRLPHIAATLRKHDYDVVMAALSNNLGAPALESLPDEAVAASALAHPGLAEASSGVGGAGAASSRARESTPTSSSAPASAMALSVRLEGADVRLRWSDEERSDLASLWTGPVEVVLAATLAKPVPADLRCPEDEAKDGSDAPKETRQQIAVVVPGLLAIDERQAAAGGSSGRGFEVLRPADSALAASVRSYARSQRARGSEAAASTAMLPDMASPDDLANDDGEDDGAAAAGVSSPDASETASVATGSVAGPRDDAMLELRLLTPANPDEERSMNVVVGSVRAVADVAFLAEALEWVAPRNDAPADAAEPGSGPQPGPAEEESRPAEAWAACGGPAIPMSKARQLSSSALRISVAVHESSLTVPQEMGSRSGASIVLRTQAFCQLNLTSAGTMLPAEIFPASIRRRCDSARRDSPEAWRFAAALCTSASEVQSGRGTGGQEDGESSNGQGRTSSSSPPASSSSSSSSSSAAAAAAAGGAAAPRQDEHVSTQERFGFASGEAGKTAAPAAEAAGLPVWWSETEIIVKIAGLSVTVDKGRGVAGVRRARILSGIDTAVHMQSAAAQPLLVALESCRFPRRRLLLTAAVESSEAVRAHLSYSDLMLFEAVLDGWTKAQSAAASSRRAAEASAGGSPAAALPDAARPPAAAASPPPLPQGRAGHSPRPSSSDDARHPDDFELWIPESASLPWGGCTSGSGGLVFAGKNHLESAPFWPGLVATSTLGAGLAGSGGHVSVETALRMLLRPGDGVLGAGAASVHGASGETDVEVSAAAGCTLRVRCLPDAIAASAPLGAAIVLINDKGSRVTPLLRFELAEVSLASSGNLSSIGAGGSSGDRVGSQLAASAAATATAASSAAAGAAAAPAEAPPTRFSGEAAPDPTLPARKLSLCVDAALTSSLWCMNGANSEWEPLLEPLTVTAKLAAIDDAARRQDLSRLATRSGRQQGPGTVAGMLHAALSVSLVRLNASQAFFASLYEAWRSLKEDIRRWRARAAGGAEGGGGGISRDRSPQHAGRQPSAARAAALDGGGGGADGGNDDDDDSGGPGAAAQLEVDEDSESDSDGDAEGGGHSGDREGAPFVFRNATGHSVRFVNDADLASTEELRAHVRSMSSSNVFHARHTSSGHGSAASARSLGSSAAAVSSRVLALPKASSFEADMGQEVEPGGEAPFGNSPEFRALLLASAAASRARKGAPNGRAGPPPVWARAWVHGMEAPSQPFRVDRVGVTPLVMHVSDSAAASVGGPEGRGLPRKVRVVAQVTVLDGRRVVTLRSSLQIHNYTARSLEVVVAEPSGRPRQSVGIVAAGQALSVPCAVALGECAIRLRPMPMVSSPAAAIYDISTPVAVPPATDPRAPSILTCLECRRSARAASDPRTNHPWCAAVRAFRRLDGAYTAVSIRPPLVVTNLLPRRAVFAVREERDTPGTWRSRGTLDPGEARDVHTLRYDAKPLISFRAEGFQSCPSVPLGPGEQACEARYTPLDASSLEAAELPTPAGISSPTAHATTRFIVESIAGGGADEFEAAEAIRATRGAPLARTERARDRAVVEGKEPRVPCIQSPARLRVCIWATHWAVDRTGAGLSYGVRMQSPPAAYRAADEESGRTGLLPVAVVPTGEAHGAQAVRMTENERYMPLRGWSSNNLLPTDPSRYTDPSGGKPVSRAVLDKLPSGSRWVSDWATDQEVPVAKDGWDYEMNFPHFTNPLRRFKPNAETMDYARRRRFVRLRDKGSEHAPARSAPLWPNPDAVKAEVGSARTAASTAAAAASAAGSGGDGGSAPIPTSEVFPFGDAVLFTPTETRQASQTLHARVGAGPWTAPLASSKHGSAPVDIRSGKNMTRFRDSQGRQLVGLAQGCLNVVQSVRPAPAPFDRSLVVSFHSRLWLANATPFALTYRAMGKAVSHGQPRFARRAVAPGAAVAVHADACATTAEGMWVRLGVQTPGGLGGWTAGVPLEQQTPQAVPVSVMMRAEGGPIRQAGALCVVPAASVVLAVRTVPHPALPGVLVTIVSCAQPVPALPPAGAVKSDRSVVSAAAVAALHQRREAAAAAAAGQGSEDDDPGLEDDEGFTGEGLASPGGEASSESALALASGLPSLPEEGLWLVRNRSACLASISQPLPPGSSGTPVSVLVPPGATVEVGVATLRSPEALFSQVLVVADLPGVQRPGEEPTAEALSAAVDAASCGADALVDFAKPDDQVRATTGAGRVVIGRLQGLGEQRTLTLFDQADPDLAAALQQPLHQGWGLAASLGLSSEHWEETLVATLDGAEVAAIDHRPREAVVAGLRGVALTVAREAREVRFEAKVRHFEVDDAAHDSADPVMLAPNGRERGWMDPEAVAAFQEALLARAGGDEAAASAIEGRLRARFPGAFSSTWAAHLNLSMRRHPTDLVFREARVAVLPVRLIVTFAALDRLYGLWCVSMRTVRASRQRFRVRRGAALGREASSHQLSPGGASPGPAALPAAGGGAAAGGAAAGGSKAAPRQQAASTEAVPLLFEADPDMLSAGPTEPIAVGTPVRDARGCLLSAARLQLVSATADASARHNEGARPDDVAERLRLVAGGSHAHGVPEVFIGGEAAAAAAVREGWSVDPDALQAAGSGAASSRSGVFSVEWLRSGTVVPSDAAAFWALEEDPTCIGYHGRSGPATFVGDSPSVVPAHGLLCGQLARYLSPRRPYRTMVAFDRLEIGELTAVVDYRQGVASSSAATAAAAGDRGLAPALSDVQPLLAFVMRSGISLERTALSVPSVIREGWSGNVEQLAADLAAAALTSKNILSALGSLVPGNRVLRRLGSRWKSAVASRDNPLEAAAGATVTAAGVVTDTAAGLTHAAGGLSRFIGRGVAAVAGRALGDDALRARAIDGGERPEHIVAGLGHAGRHLAGGVWHGVTGIVSRPIQGARDGGVAGFAAGIARGLAGAVVNPVVGIFNATGSVMDGVSGSIEGVTRIADDTAFVNSTAAVRMGRLRVPRAFYGVSQTMRPYTEPDAVAAVRLAAAAFEGTRSASRKQDMFEWLGGADLETLAGGSSGPGVFLGILAPPSGATDLDTCLLASTAGVVEVTVPADLADSAVVRICRWSSILSVDARPSADASAAKVHVTLKLEGRDEGHEVALHVGLPPGVAGNSRRAGQYLEAVSDNLRQVWQVQQQDRGVAAE